MIGMSSRELAKDQSVRQLSGLPSSDQLLTASSLMDQRTTPNLWNYTAWVDGNVSAVLDSRAFRINLDIFRGYGSEAELVRIATDHQERNRLGISAVMAGIVFQVSTALRILAPQSNVCLLEPSLQRYSAASAGPLQDTLLRVLCHEPGRAAGLQLAAGAGDQEQGVPPVRIHIHTSTPFIL